jgi:hypothetical protein
MNTDEVEATIADLCYTTGRRTYDDMDMGSIPPNRAYTNHVRRGIAHMTRFAKEGISDPIDSFLNYDL